jgi:hypothetical protein
VAIFGSAEIVLLSPDILLQAVYCCNVISRRNGGFNHHCGARTSDFEQRIDFVLGAALVASWMGIPGESERDSGMKPNANPG